MSKRITKGFSLIEVLVALLILSSSIAIAQAILSQYVSSVERFSARSEMLGNALNIVNEVRHEVKNGTFSGRITRLSLACEYNQEGVEVTRPKAFNFETGTSYQEDTEFSLHKVKVVCKHSRGMERTFTIEVLSVKRLAAFEF